MKRQARGQKIFVVCGLTKGQYPERTRKTFMYQYDKEHQPNRNRGIVYKAVAEAQTLNV